MSMKKRNILVFPCGSEIALDIYSSVKHSTYFNLIGANSVDDHGKFVYEDYIPNIPFVTEDTFIPTLKRIVKERDIDAVYPTMDAVITKTKLYEDAIGCKVIASPAATAKICLSKKMTYDVLKEAVKTPKIYYSPNKIPAGEFPVFGKPIVGYSARGTKKLHTQKEVDSYLSENKDVLIMEYLPGEEFTVDCFTDKSGMLLYCGARKRNRISNGISVNTFFVKNQEIFQEIASEINSKIRFQGAWFYQVKYDKKGDLCLLEIASRLGGSSLLSRAMGINLALLSLFDAFGYDVKILKNSYNVELDRALECKYKTNIDFDSVYCDYDDCLVLNNNEINIELISFLYKCINEKKKIFLLTKHEGSVLEDELKKFRLSFLFDEIIHISKEEKKSEYIKTLKPIFIDDSNSERLEIKNRLNIPVFSPDMIDIFK